MHVVIFLLSGFFRQCNSCNPKIVRLPEHSKCLYYFLEIERLETTAHAHVEMA